MQPWRKRHVAWRYALRPRPFYAKLFWVIKMKRVLITGGATGIGRAAAALFLKKGYDVWITCHETKPELRGVTAVLCDVTNEADVLRLFKTVPPVDVLVNNAGVSLVGLVQDTTLADYQEVMGVNCTGVFLCCREGMRSMLQRHSGAIINVASMWGECGASCEAVYSMSKAGVIGFTRALAKEAAPSGIMVNCVSPGIIDTRMNAQFDPAALAAEVPIGRLGTPAEAAEAILFLAESSYITGQVLGVNGGIL